MVLIFDIGKTNKKVFLFNQEYQIISQSEIRIPEILDFEAYPCDDVKAIEKWIRDTVNQFIERYRDTIKAINFAAYGASFVHLDKNGRPVIDLINYLKPIPDALLNAFYSRYGDKIKIARETASPALGMLNSGMQFYWLKYAHPDIFKRIKHSLHLPQYLSYLLTGIPVSEFTSIGCHTMLWDFSEYNYHNWVFEEGIDRILPEIVPTYASTEVEISGVKLKIGSGIHDSSAALIPYLWKKEKTFVLISTGTWSISLNPFNHSPLTDEELKNDCLQYLRADGKPVKAARIFLGEEHRTQLENLQRYFNVNRDPGTAGNFDDNIYKKATRSDRKSFAYKYLKTPWSQPEPTCLDHFDNFEEAYFQLIRELVQLQIRSLELVAGEVRPEIIYIDGGFAKNTLFVRLLSENLAGVQIETVRNPMATAIGAAMAIVEHNRQ